LSGKIIVGQFPECDEFHVQLIIPANAEGTELQRRGTCAVCRVVSVSNFMMIGLN